MQQHLKWLRPTRSMRDPAAIAATWAAQLARQHMRQALVPHNDTTLACWRLQDYQVPHRRGHCDLHVARRLAAAHGDQARHVTQIAEKENLGRRLVPWHDVIDAEVVYAARFEA